MGERAKLHLNFPAAEPAPKPVRELGVMPAVEDCDESGLIVLAVVRPDRSSLAVRLGPAEAIAVAGDLIEAARARLGRSNWPPKAS